jgi:hypothetical protein
MIELSTPHATSWPFNVGAVEEGGGIVSQHRADSAEFQVHCLGNSADLGALRRSLEARGVVSRSRLTPAVQAVVADSTVPADHPTLISARELGIEVLDPSEAIDRLLATPGPASRRNPTPPVSNTPLITLTVLVLISVLTMLGVVGALIDSDTPAHEVTVNELSEPLSGR